jgi:hypothetical protein
LLLAVAWWIFRRKKHSGNASGFDGINSPEASNLAGQSAYVAPPAITSFLGIDLSGFFANHPSLEAVYSNVNPAIATQWATEQGTSLSSFQTASGAVAQFDAAGGDIGIDSIESGQANTPSAADIAEETAGDFGGFGGIFNPITGVFDPGFDASPGFSFQSDARNYGFSGLYRYDGSVINLGGKDTPGFTGQTG